VEQAATDITSSYLAQMGLFGLGLIVIGAFLWLWLRESRAVRADTETIIARKDEEITRKDTEIAGLKKQLSESEAKERATYSALMDCMYPKKGGMKA
jgi:Skp family chaperone for outer membrane proteins